MLFVVCCLLFLFILYLSKFQNIFLYNFISPYVLVFDEEQAAKEARHIIEKRGVFQVLQNGSVRPANNSRFPLPARSNNNTNENNMNSNKSHSNAVPVIEKKFIKDYRDMKRIETPRDAWEDGETNQFNSLK